MADELKVPSMPSMMATIDSFGVWLSGIERYLEELANVEKKLTVAEEAYGDISQAIRSIVLIPSTGEFVYEPAAVQQRERDDNSSLPPSEWVYVNRHVPGSEKTDVVVALDQLQAAYPKVKYVSVAVAWFGDDLRAGTCKLQPRVADNRIVTIVDGFSTYDAPKIETFPHEWTVQGLGRMDVPLISLDSLLPDAERAYSSTPSDRSVVNLIAELNRRGLKTTFYPFILMDVPPGNVLPSPYGGSTQPVFPWRGRITCDPAPGVAGTVDGTSTAKAQIDTLIGTCARTDFTQRPDQSDVTYSGPAEWSFRRFILHYAHLCAVAGGVDSFLIGTELRGLTWVRDGAGGHPFVDGLMTIADDVKAILGSSTKVSYAADWSEFTPYQTPDGNLDFHLDDLWSSESIDAIGIDNYWPLSDWRGTTGIDEDAWPNIYDPAYLASGISGGEGYDFFYASETDRINQVRTPITDGKGKPWVYRYKDIKNWWSNQHFNRVGALELTTPTPWVPRSKPIWFTELGCPSIDKGANQPNVFVDPKSSESFFPYFSLGTRDDLMQRRYIAAFHAWYAAGVNNPRSTVYKGRMLDTDRIYVYCWDARPYPEFPNLIDVWGDGPNWERGHWITGRPVAFPGPETPENIGDLIDLMPVRPMPKGEPAVDPATGQLKPGMHHYLAQIETIAKRLKNLQIIAVTETTR